MAERNKNHFKYALQALATVIVALVTLEATSLIQYYFSRKTIYDDGLIDFLDERIKTLKIDPKMIDMEVTESLAAKDTAFLLQLVTVIPIRNSTSST